MNQTKINKKLKQLQKALNLRNEAMTLFATATDSLEYERAAKKFLEAKERFTSLSYIAYCLEGERLATWKAAGISDFKYCVCGNPACEGEGIWFGGQQIAFSDAKEIENRYRNARKSGRYIDDIDLNLGKSKRRRSGPSIKETVFGLFDEHGMDGISYKKTKKVVLGLKPNSKFDETHFGYYKSKYKQQIKTK